MTPTIGAANDPLTIEQILKQAETLRAEDAIAQWGQNGFAARCTSPVYDRVLDSDGRVIELHLVDGQYAAVYCRVSMIKQRGETRDDGYSIKDQVIANVRWCTSQGYQFRIFNDAGLGGGLPTKDCAMIQEMRDKNAELYEEAFRNALLCDTNDTLPDALAGMENYLKIAVKQLRTGGVAEDETKVVGDRTETRKDHNWPVIESVFRKFVVHKKNEYRPALHLMMADFPSIHTIVVTHYDRLSRSMLLSAVLRRHLLAQHVKVWGTVESLDWATDKELLGVVMNSLLPYFTEKKLKEVKVGCIRGLAQMLRTRRPHSQLPFFIKRDDRGYATWNESDPAIRAIRRALELYRASAANKWGVHGYHQIAAALTAEGYPAPDGHIYKERNDVYIDAGAVAAGWSHNSVRNLLQNTWLYGVQVVFGREWPMCEGIISRDEFRQLQTLRCKRASSSKSSSAGIGGYAPIKHTYSGILHCACGYRMQRQAGHAGTGEVDKYYCAAPAQRKRALNVALGQQYVHVGLHLQETNRFFDSLFNQHSEFLLGLYGEGPAQSNAAAEIVVAEANICMLEEALTAKTQALETDAREIARRQVKVEAGERFLRIYEQTLANLMYDDQEAILAARERINMLQAEINSGVALMDESRSPDEWMVEFAKTSDPEKRNTILRKFISRLQCVRAEDGSERIDIHVRGGAILPVPLELRSYRRGKNQRLFPDLQAWLPTVL